jgi:hypothetical protein
MILPLREPFRPARVRIPTQYEMVHEYFQMRDSVSRILGWRIRCNRLLPSDPLMQIEKQDKFTSLYFTYREFYTYLYCLPGKELVSSHFDNDDPKTWNNMLTFMNTEKSFSYGQSLCLALNLLPENEFPQDSKK